MPDELLLEDNSTYRMLADNRSIVGVACTTIGAYTAAEQHICVPRLINAASVHILLCNCLRAMIICLQVQ